MPVTKIQPHVHLETDCHCPTIEVPTEVEVLTERLHKALRVVNTARNYCSRDTFSGTSYDALKQSIKEYDNGI